MEMAILVIIVIAIRIIAVKTIEMFERMEEETLAAEKKLFSKFEVQVVEAQFKESPRFGMPGTIVEVELGIIFGGNGKGWQEWTKSYGKTPVDKLNKYFYDDSIGTEKTKFRLYKQRMPIGDVIQW